MASSLPVYIDCQNRQVQVCIKVSEPIQCFVEAGGSIEFDQMASQQWRSVLTLDVGCLKDFNLTAVVPNSRA